MDLNDYWQENKRFVTSVGVGALLFLFGLYFIGATYGEELSSARASKSRLERQLNEARYEAADREVARSENDALGAAFARLGSAIEFEARPGFRLEASGGAPVNQYHRAVARVRERLLADAGRGNLFLDPQLGLPDLSPSTEDEITRYLEALDAVDRAVNLALETGIDRIDDVRIRLDAGLNSRQGVGVIERTRVELELAGTGLALGRFLEETQRPRSGNPLTVGTFELTAAGGRREEARLDLGIELVRLHEPAGDDDELGGAGL